jgi:predicted protein tyrosine phosphatase
MEKKQQYGLLQGFEWRRDTEMVYCSASNEEETAMYSRVSNGERTVIWSTAVVLMEKRQKYGLLQRFKLSRDNNIVYCRDANGEETAE